MYFFQWNSLLVNDPFSFATHHIYNYKIVDNLLVRQLFGNTTGAVTDHGNYVENSKLKTQISVTVVISRSHVL